jgi:hypothetical protein
VRIESTLTRYPFLQPAHRVFQMRKRRFRQAADVDHIGALSAWSRSARAMPSRSSRGASTISAKISVS